jgi:alpha-N-arabinofuranosidase
VVEGQIKAARVGNLNARPIHIAFDEWNVWYRTLVSGEFNIGRTGLEEKYNYEDALAMGMFLNAFFRHADIVKMANLAQLVNVIGPIFSNKDGLYLQTIYFPLQEYGKQRGNQSLDTWVQSPQYKPDAGRAMNYLDVSSTYDPKSRRVFINVLNRSEKQDISAQVASSSGTIGGSVSVWELNHPDLKATHTFGNDKVVRPVTRTIQVTNQNNGFSYSFPKHSLTILTLQL